MFGRLMPREGNFFELFNQHAERIVEGSRELVAMITTFQDVAESVALYDLRKITRRPSSSPTSVT